MNITPSPTPPAPSPAPKPGDPDFWERMKEKIPKK